MTAIDETPSAGRAGPPPITAAERRAERATAAMDLAVRLGRVPRPSTVATARPVPPARKSVPHEPLPVVEAAPQRQPIPADVLDHLVQRPLAPGDFFDASAPVAPASRAPTVAMIVGAVAAYYGRTRLDLISARRDKATTRPRQLAMWIAATLTTATMGEIGRRIGRRDHTTVIHGCRAVEARLAADPALKADADALIALLTRAA